MKKCKLKLVYLIGMLLFSIVSLQAQTKSVTGVVKDANGETMPGVSVVIKGTTIGVVTDVDGSYSLSVPGEQSTLVFSFIGQTPIEIVVGKQTVINVAFEDESVALGNVVVIGYGSVKKKDLTGAVSSITEKDLTKGVVSPDRMLAGKVAGVHVTPGGGSPGESSRIRIRGGASLNASNDPLIILDGIPLTGGNLNTINPNDIESMNILKDASSTAIYGSRASNGVIIITTKQAKYGDKLKIEFLTQNKLSTPDKMVDVLSGDEMRKLVRDYKGKDSFKGLVGTYSTDWQDEIFRTAFGTDTNLSISGGLSLLPYRVSIGLLNEDGILKNDNMKRATASVNLNPRLFDNHLKIDINIRGTQNKFRSGENSVSSAVLFDPTQPVMACGYNNYHGYFNWELSEGKYNTQGLPNPVMSLNEIEKRTNATRLILGAQVDYKMHFLPELRANLNLGYDYSRNKGTTYIPIWFPTLAHRYGANNQSKNNSANKLFEFYLNYNKEFDSLKSHIDATAGYTYQDWLTKRYNFNDYNTYGDMIGSEALFPYDRPQNTMISFFGRVNYTLMDKYLLTASIRRDGTSRFDKDSRWGMFPALALAWKINEESFLKDVESIDELKLRIGYGETGQQDIPTAYGHLNRYQIGANDHMYYFGNEYYYVYRPSPYDKTLKWESTTTYNIALDYGLFKNRLSGSIDFYLKKTKDLFAKVDLAAGSNLTNSMITNIGKMENRGVEFNLNAKIVEGKDWNWDVNANLGYNKNKITKLTMVEMEGYKGIPQGWLSSSTNTVQIHTVGYNMYSFFLYKQIYDENGKPLEGVYADLDNNGIINDDDKYRTKSAEPKLTFGLSSNLSFKNWSLSTTLRGSAGNYMFNFVNSRAIYNNLFSPANVLLNVPKDILNTHFTNNQPGSDYYLENASFIKMDNLSLSYDFGRLANKVGLRTTFSVQNVFTITKYSGIDPEIAGGVDKDLYPRPRVFMLGASFNF